MKNTSQEQPHYPGKYQFTSLLLIYLVVKNLLKVCVSILCGCYPLSLPFQDPTIRRWCLEAKKWQAVNCVSILTPPFCVCMPIFFPVMLVWSKEQHFGKNNRRELEDAMLLTDWWTMASHSAKHCPVFLFFVSPPLSFSLSLLGRYQQDMIPYVLYKSKQ